MPLFDVGLPRLDLEAARYAEPHFPYLNASGRAVACRVRNLLENWFAEVPQQAKEPLRRRFRSRNDDTHHGAFFELYVYTLLRRRGYAVEVLDAGPIGTGTIRRPDFRVRGPDQQTFLVEATIATGKSKEDSAAERVVQAAYDALNRIESPNFFLGIRVHGAPRRLPKVRQLRAEIEPFLASLDPDDVVRVLKDGSYEDLPRKEIALAEGHLEITALPKSPKNRSKPGLRPVGLSGVGEIRWVDESVALRKAVVSKATRYGALEEPYFIAVNAMSQHLDQIDIMEALFGKESYVVSIAEGKSGEPRMERLPNGAWLGPKGPINTRVSGVIVASSLSPWSVARTTPIVYHNPFATRRLINGFPGAPEGCCAREPNGRTRW